LDLLRLSLSVAGLAFSACAIGVGYYYLRHPTKRPHLEVKMPEMPKMIPAKQEENPEQFLGILARAEEGFAKESALESTSEGDSA
jgi:hypothetical protein